MGDIRAEFEEVFPVPKDSGIEWYEDRRMYLTKDPMWKRFAKGMSDSFYGWQQSRDYYRSR